MDCIPSVVLTLYHQPWEHPANCVRTAQQAGGCKNQIHSCSGGSRQAWLSIYFATSISLACLMWNNFSLWMKKLCKNAVLLAVALFLSNRLIPPSLSPIPWQCYNHQTCTKIGWSNNCWQKLHEGSDFIHWWEVNTLIFTLMGTWWWGGVMAGGSGSASALQLSFSLV